MSSYLFFSIYFNVWYITCCPKWEEALEFTCRVIGEALVIGLLVVVYEIPCSSCIFNTVPVVLVACVIGSIYSWFLPMWILDLSILSICRVYTRIYVRLMMSSYLFLRIYFNVWYITCCPKWEEALDFTYRVIGEVLLVVVYNIRKTSAVSTAVWMVKTQLCKLCGTSDTFV